jgi:peroxiredoxin
LDAEVVAVSNDQLSGAERAVEYLDLGFPVLFDPGTEVIDSYGVFNTLQDGYATPSIFIIDKSGDIRWKYVGRHYNDRPTNDQIIAQLEALQTG